MGKELIMEIKKTFIPGIILSVIAILIGSNAFIEGFVLTAISIILCIKFKDKYRVNLTAYLTVPALITSVYGLILFIEICREPCTSTSYWLYNLIMK